MDDKFRLVFVCPEQTPSADAYLAADAIVCERLHDAIKIGGETAIVWGVPFIAHRFLVLEPVMIDLLYRELVAATTSSASPTSS